MSDTPSEDLPKPDVSRYVLRFLPRARREAEDAALRFAELAGEEIATAWLTGFEEAVASLAANPHRFPLVPEKHLARQETRQLLYRRSPSSVAYRILFFVKEGDDQDAPTITIIHVRHASRRPLSQGEARTLRQNQE